MFVCWQWVKLAMWCKSLILKALTAWGSSAGEKHTTISLFAACFPLNKEIHMLCVCVRLRVCLCASPCMFAHLCVCLCASPCMFVRMCAVCLCVLAVYACVRECCVCVWAAGCLDTCALTNLSNCCDRPAIIVVRLCETSNMFIKHVPKRNRQGRSKGQAA